MRLLVFLLATLLALPVAAQEMPGKKKPAAKKSAAAKKTSHRKPTPEQIRKFNELEKKQKQ
jgi:hypothetical protein